MLRAFAYREHGAFLFGLRLDFNPFEANILRMAYVESIRWKPVPEEVLCIGVTILQFRHFAFGHGFRASSYGSYIQVANHHVFYRMVFYTRNQRPLPTVVLAFDVTDDHVAEESRMFHLLVQPAPTVAYADKNRAAAAVDGDIFNQDILHVSPVYRG